MNASELFLSDGRSAKVWYCAGCRLVKTSEAEAESCCLPYKCNTCGADCEKYHTLCRVCVVAKMEQQERERFEKAEKLTTWDGWVYSEGRGFNEGYFGSVGDFLEWLDEEFDGEKPSYVWACQSEAFASADLDQILQHIEENAYEDFDPSTLSGIPELKTAIDRFNEANAGVLSYTPDYSKAIPL